MINLNKKQCEAYHDNHKEIQKLVKLKKQVESVYLSNHIHKIDVIQNPLILHEHKFSSTLSKKLQKIEQRINQLTLLNTQVEQFIDSLPSYEKEIMTDFYLKQMPRQQCAHKYYCDVRTLTRMINRILQEYYPYEVVL